MLGYSYIDPTPVTIPERSINGGLYTGQKFIEGAPWANVPVEPDVVPLSKNLQSANPPPRAAPMLPSYTRPGNNQVNSPYHETYHPAYPNIRALKPNQ